MLVTFLTLLTLSFTVLKGCVPLEGIGNGVDEIEWDGAGMGAWFFPFLQLQEVVFGTEPAVDFRIVTHNSLALYNIASAYNEIYMEGFAREDVNAARKRCVAGEDQNTVNQYLDVSIAYGLYFTSLAFYLQLGLTKEELDMFFTDTVGYDPDICTNIPNSCNSGATPWGFAKMIVDEVEDWAFTDGYNADGAYNRQYNRIPYQDWRDRPFVPANTPWDLEYPDLWQPLLESNGIGFLYNQEHVVSHIGFTGRFHFLTDEWACSRNVPDPEYDYELEIDLLLERMRTLTDFQKGETVLYDNKGISVLRLTLLYDVNQGYFPYDTEFFLRVFLANDLSMETTQIVWRNKVLQNRIRPPSIIHYLRGDDDITTYAGVDADGNSYGTQTFKGRDFESYIRTMPHAEYPSGSACLCEAVANFYKNITGSNSITDTLGQTLSLFWEAGSSTKENGVPANTVQYEYSTWSDISYACGIGRLNGGMHFTAAINASNELCGPAGDIFAAVRNALANGERPAYVVDITDPASRLLVQDRCNDYPRGPKGKGKGKGKGAKGKGKGKGKGGKGKGPDGKGKGKGGKGKGPDGKGKGKGKGGDRYSDEDEYERTSRDETRGGRGERGERSESSEGRESRDRSRSESYSTSDYETYTRSRGSRGGRGDRRDRDEGRSRGWRL